MSDKSGYYGYDECSFESLDAATPPPCQATPLTGGKDLLDFVLIKESDGGSGEEDEYSLESIFDPDGDIAERFI